ncbi:MAG: chemotaxis protein, partial [Bdellovibrio sp.]
LAKDISQASKEQSLGVSEINKAMNQLDAATNQNSHTSEQAAAAAEDLFRQAGSLKDAVNHLIDLMEGTNSSSSLQDHGLPDDVSHGEPLKKVS